MNRAVFIIFLVALSISVYRADSFVDLWLTPNQQGSISYHNEEYTRAAQHFDARYNKGLSYYAASDFYNAIATLQALETAQSLFVIGNAYAQLDELEASIQAYNEALTINPGFAAAKFNLNWVSGLKELDDKQFDDAGGTDGKLGADGFVVDDKADNATAEMSAPELEAAGMSDEQIEELWMRRVQTTPGDFLAYKFAFQAQAGEQP